MDGLSELSNEAAGARPAGAGQAGAVMSEPYFELDVLSDDDETDIYARSEAIFQPMAAEPQRTARKVRPNEIPAGHVDVEDGYTPPVLFTEFNENDPDSFVGKTVKGRYVATEFLGGDASGLAYVAHDKIHGDRKVLVRILLGEEGDEDLETMLAEERVSLSHFTHPNIARLIDSGAFADGTKFLISEFVDALSAADILSIHGAFEPHRAARIIRQLASALSEAHQEGIVHRDLRPENVIIDASDGDGEQQTKLVNFGASNGEPNKVNFLYRAPEVLEGRPSTPASDVYSLGVVAFEMLTGRLPFAAESERELLKKIGSNNRLAAHEVDDRLPAWVDGILGKAIAAAPGERYAKARELGDALLSALPEPAVEKPSEQLDPDEIELELDGPPKGRSVAVPAGTVNVEPAWKARSPEPPVVEDPRTKWLAAAGIGLLVILVIIAWNYASREPSPSPASVASNENRPAIVPSSEMPPQPRSLSQPANTNYYQNSKQNLKGDLLLNFVGFTLYYPKDWKVNGPQQGIAANSRGKFLDISRHNDAGQLLEQMLVSYYPSRGTFTYDVEKFPQLVRESSDTLRKILPGYQVISEGEIKLNGEWRAYEMKFQGAGTSAEGEKMIVWGRRLFIPAARPGIRNGFEVTMLATSLAGEVKSVEDVGVKGELASILYTFEPSQNF